MVLWLKLFNDSTRIKNSKIFYSHIQGHGAETRSEKWKNETDEWGS